jgi:pimeloyl-ACP methyl ester carboxylesterase
MGHSLGAMIGLYFAAHYPEKLSKLILIDAGGRLPWNSIEEQPLWLTASISRLGTPVASYDEFIQRLKLAPFIGPYWDEYLDIYFEHDVYRQHDGSVISKCSPAAVHEDQTDFHAYYKPEAFWPRVTVPTLLLRAGKEVLSPNDQVLTEAGAEEVRHAIRDCQYINYPHLNHYTIVFLAKNGPAQGVRDFVG